MASEDLAVFLAVADAGSIGRAAERLNIVQSAVTTRIRKLEEGLGVLLFRRHARGGALTAFLDEITAAGTEQPLIAAE